MFYMNLNNQKLFKIAFVLYLITIIAVSSIPGRSLPRVIILSPDKLLHMTEYAILAGLAYLGFRQFSNPLLAGLVLFTCFDEIWQSFIPGRMSSVYDVIADILGITIVITVVYFRSSKNHD